MIGYKEHINQISGFPEGKIFHGVHSPEKFAAIINRERDRTDRTSQEFSMVVFEVEIGKGISASTRHLIPVLTQRIRSTDDVGWLEDGRIAVVLPHTASDGAWMFADKIRQTYNGTHSCPAIEVYTYPSLGGSTGNGRESRRKTDDLDATDRIRSVEELDSQFLCRIPAWKRAIDILGSILAFILLMPLLLLVAILIKVVSPGPVFFRQERVGYMGRVFTIWKYRTMHVNADTAVHKQYLQDLINNEKEMTKLDNGKDRRIIPFGRILRVTGIDELPQLLNVFLGDMSLVGPRPCLPYEANEFQAWQKRRFDTIPGLTGLWQVSGKNRTTFKEMMRLDITYARKRAFLLDIKIFLKTIPAIISQVMDKPALAFSRTKVFAFLARIAASVLAFLSLLA